jgi:hypothetical protein
MDDEVIAAKAQARTRGSELVDEAASSPTGIHAALRYTKSPRASDWFGDRFAVAPRQLRDSLLRWSRSGFTASSPAISNECSMTPSN